MSGTAARKVVVYGASGCGKTSLMRRWSDGEFSSNETPTLGVNVVIRNGTQVWDTSGQDRFHALSLTYLTGAHAVLFVYSIGNYASFEQLKRYWIPLVLKAGMPGLALYMVGAKQDLEEQDVINGGLREVSVQDAVELAASYDLHYGEASAKNGHGLDHIKLFLEDHQQPHNNRNQNCKHWMWLQKRSFLNWSRLQNDLYYLHGAVVVAPDDDERANIQNCSRENPSATDD